MVNVRWKPFIGALLFLVATPIWANTLYSSALLSEANSLVNIVPEQAKRLATNYLTQRTLTDKTEKSPSAISRDEADNRTRTPGGTIDALRILARAEANLGNEPEALNILKEAKHLATVYKLPYLLIDLKLVETKLKWHLSGNAQAAQQSMNEIEQEFSQIENPQQLARGLKYRLTMLKAEVASTEGNLELATQLYQEVKPYVDESKSIHTIIDYHTTVGKQLLANKKYNRALSELLISYWTAIETDSARQLAEVNRILGQLFYDRKVLDKANDHFSQAADFYDNYENSPALAPLLKRMGDIYYYQGKYNLALVHYFNAMDHERLQNNIESVIDIRISLAATYLNLVNFPLTEQYLERAQELLQYADIPKLKAYALLLDAGLARHKKLPKKVIDSATQALDIAKDIQDISLQKSAYNMLYLGYELNGQYQQALNYLKQYN
ncbi:tetratricopeptide repeat protein, partial [Vibrio sp. M260118]|uniref:tetratricopeptide repeat protein n=1 Tax=Vibrio sp. M260118 TaxID=3020896 RepID=UPI002F488360